MVAPVQKDSLTDYQVALATYLRISSPVAGMFTGSEIKPNPNARSIRVPDIRVLFMSGFTGDALTGEDDLGDEHSFIQKPFASQALLQRIRHLLDTPKKGFSTFTGHP